MVRVKTPIMFQFISTPGLNAQHVVLIIRIFPATLSPALPNHVLCQFNPHVSMLEIPVSFASFAWWASAFSWPSGEKWPNSWTSLSPLWRPWNINMHVSDGLAKESVSGFCFWRWSIYNDLQTYLKLVCNSSLQLTCHNVDTKTYIFSKKRSQKFPIYNNLRTFWDTQVSSAIAAQKLERKMRGKNVQQKCYIRWIWRCWAMLGTRIHTFSGANILKFKGRTEICWFTYLKFHPKIVLHMKVLVYIILYNSIYYYTHKSTTSSIKYRALLACRICRIVEIHWPIDTQKRPFHEENHGNQLLNSRCIGHSIKTHHHQSFFLKILQSQRLFLTHSKGLNNTFWPRQKQRLKPHKSS